MTSTTPQQRHPSRAVSEPTRTPGRRIRSDRGEGVISTAIAVLIMAFIGVAMWIGFNRMWSTAEANTAEQVSQIGR